MFICFSVQNLFGTWTCTLGIPPTILGCAILSYGGSQTKNIVHRPQTNCLKQINGMHNFQQTIGISEVPSTTAAAAAAAATTTTSQYEGSGSLHNGISWGPWEFSVTQRPSTGRIGQRFWFHLLWTAWFSRFITSIHMWWTVMNSVMKSGLFFSRFNWHFFFGRQVTETQGGLTQRETSHCLLCHQQCPTLSFETSSSWFWSYLFQKRIQTYPNQNIFGRSWQSSHWSNKISDEAWRSRTSNSAGNAWPTKWPWWMRRPSMVEHWEISSCARGGEGLERRVGSCNSLTLKLPWYVLRCLWDVNNVVYFTFMLIDVVAWSLF